MLFKKEKPMNKPTMHKTTNFTVGADPFTQKILFTYTFTEGQVQHWMRSILTMTLAEPWWRS